VQVVTVTQSGTSTGSVVQEVNVVLCHMCKHTTLITVYLFLFACSYQQCSVYEK